MKETRKPINLFIAICIAIMSVPCMGNAQTYYDHLSTKSDSLVNFLSQGPSSQIVAQSLNDYLENPDLLRELNELEQALAASKGNDSLEMMLNLQLGRLTKWNGRGQPYKHFTRALFLAEKLNYPKIVAEASLEVGNTIRLGSVGNRPWQSYYESAIEMLDPYDDPLLKSHQLYAKLILATNNSDRLKFADEAISLLKSNLDRNDRLMMESLARHLNAAGNYQPKEESIRTFEEALAIAKESEHYLMQAYILNNLGFVFITAKEYEKAIPYHLEALDVAVFAGLKGLFGNASNNLAVCYRNLGMYKEALDFYQCFAYVHGELTSDKYSQNLAKEKVTHELDKIELRNELLVAEQQLQNRQRLILSVTSILLLIIATTIFWSRRKINHANIKLRALDELKSRFFANISHELRTPITLINGPTDAMLKGEYGHVPDELVQGLSVIKNNGNRLATMVNEILDLTKLEAGKMQLTENPVQFYPLLLDLLAAYQSEIDTRNIQFQFIYDYDENCSLLLDEAKFGKIINNLLSNAFKFTPEQGQIVFRVHQLNGDLQMRITDSGAGIHPDDIEHIFDRFYQSKQPGLNAQGGTGIGLALSQELAKLHHGSIQVESQPGAGSEFTFSFIPKPTSTEYHHIDDQLPDYNVIKTSLDEAISQYANIFDIEKPVLLLVEDHAEMRSFISQIVNPFFNVIEVENGARALDILGRQPVDLIISDVMMPIMDGFELLEHIKQNRQLKSISIIMLTARSAEEDKLFALTLGVDDYLTKPFNREELLIRTRNILENRITRKLSQNENQHPDDQLPNVNETFINSLKSIVEKHIADGLLSVAYLASEVSIGERQLHRKIKALTGYSPIQFIKEIRLQRARYLLENQRVSTVAEASYQVGFDKVQYFSSQYTNRFGKRPSEALLVR